MKLKLKVNEKFYRIAVKAVEIKTVACRGCTHCREVLAELPAPLKVLKVTPAVFRVRVECDACMGQYVTPHHDPSSNCPRKERYLGRKTSE